MGVMQGLLVWLTVVMAELAVAHTALDSLCAMLLHQKSYYHVNSNSNMVVCCSSIIIV